MRFLARRGVIEQTSIQLVQIRILPLNSYEGARVLAQYATFCLEDQGVAVVSEG